MELNLTYLYPDLLNLYGDRGNVQAIRKVCAQMGIDMNLNRVDRLAEPLDFETTDMILLSPGEPSTFPVIIDRLKKDYDRLEKYIESGGYIFAAGTASCIFADEVRRITKPSYSGLGFGGFVSAEREVIYGDDIVYRCSPSGIEREVAGNQIQTFDTILNPDSTPFGEVIYGYGNAHSKDEGVRYRNLIITNALGPVLVKNPWIVADIAADIMTAKGHEVDKTRLDFEWEEKSFETIKKFNLEKKSNL